MATDAETAVTEVVEEKSEKAAEEKREDDELDQPPKRWWSPELLIQGGVCVLLAIVAYFVAIQWTKVVVLALYAAFLLILEGLTIRRGAPTMRYVQFVERGVGFAMMTMLTTALRLIN